MTISAMPMILLFLGLWFMSGCINRATATLEPGANLSAIKSYYVVHQPKDTHQIHDLIRDRLIKDGLSATAGPELTQGNYNVDSIITYVDRWVWDITLYLLELTVTLRDANSGFPLAVGNSFHTSLTRKSPEEMVDEVMTNIFTAAKTTNQRGTP